MECHKFKEVSARSRGLRYWVTGFAQGLLSNLVDDGFWSGGGLLFFSVDEQGAGDHVFHQLAAVQEPPVFGS